MQIDLTDRSFLKKLAWFVIAAEMSTIALELIAYLLTQSVGLFSDVMGSGANLIGALMALAMLIVAARPPDKDHHPIGSRLTGGIG